MKRLIIFMTAVFFSISAFANDWQKFMLENSAPMLSPESESGGATIVVKKKNPKAAFVMSAVIPGAGQVYAKSYIKAAAFVAIEAAAWTYYVQNNDKGRDLETQFQAYANTHWSEEEYWRWISYHSGIAYSQENMEALREWEHQSFSHGLHREKDQQYYEMIGKYHQFSWGWDDFRTDPNNSISMTDEQITQRYNETGQLNPNRYYYETQRDASNDAFKKATTGATVALVNHLLSAADAAWTTTRYNRKIDVSLRLEPIYLSYETQTVLTLRVNW